MDSPDFYWAYPFLLFSFSVFTLVSCRPHVRLIKLTHVGFRAHVKIASRIVSYRVRSSVCLSHPSTAAAVCGGFAAECSAVATYQLSLDLCRKRPRSAANAGGGEFSAVENQVLFGHVENQPRDEAQQRLVQARNRRTAAWRVTSFHKAIEW